MFGWPLFLRWGASLKGSFSVSISMPLKQLDKTKSTSTSPSLVRGGWAPFSQDRRGWNIRHYRSAQLVRFGLLKTLASAIRN